MRKKQYRMIWLLTAGMLLGSMGCGKEAGTQKPPVVSEKLPVKETAEVVQIGDLKAAGSYEEILELLARSNRLDYTIKARNFDLATEVPESVAVVNEAVADSGIAADGAAGNAFSDTNVQVQGIAEGDIVKTDGSYLYVLSRSSASGARVHIISTEGGKPELVSSISLSKTLEQKKNVSVYNGNAEMYLAGDKLIFICQYSEDDAYEIDEADQLQDYRIWHPYRCETKTQISIYDITDREKPVLAVTHMQDGRYLTSREKDGYLYLITHKNNDYYYICEPRYDITDDLEIRQEATEAENKAEYDKQKNTLPQIDDCVLLPERIYYKEDWAFEGYTIVSAIHLEKPDEIADSVSLMTNSEQCYMGQESIYLTAGNWWTQESDCDMTELVRIGYKDGKLWVAAKNSVKGMLDDRFSMDEKDGYLRIVTTVNHYRERQEKDYSWREYTGMDNALYILDADLNVAGSLENLAEDERIYSARFIGDIAYFVTFRNRDPLFSVDVSDPKNPVLLGALKIPGFSDYLQPYGEHLLLGIGYGSSDSQDEEKTDCLKLSMFDISDPANVTEKDTLLLPEYSSSEACYNSRAVLVNAGKGIIGFPTESYYWEEEVRNNECFWSYENHKGYAVYHYDEESGFRRKLSEEYAYGEVYESCENENVYETEQRELRAEEVRGNAKLTKLSASEWNDLSMRGIYIGDKFYLINTLEEITVYDMQNAFEQTAALSYRD